MDAATRSVCLPNGKVVLCDDNDYIEISGVAIDLETVIHYDFEGFLDFISETATGSIAMKDISYELNGTNENKELVFTVTGCITDIIEDCSE